MIQHGPCCRCYPMPFVPKPLGWAQPCIASDRIACTRAKSLVCIPESILGQNLQFNKWCPREPCLLLCGGKVLFQGPCIQIIELVAYARFVDDILMATIADADVIRSRLIKQAQTHFAVEIEAYLKLPPPCWACLCERPVAVICALLAKLV